MKDLAYVLDEEARLLTGKTNVNELPLPVADDWDMLVEKANSIAEVIDKHLDFEESFQGVEMRPLRLCPEQRVSLISDLSAVAR